MAANFNDILEAFEFVSFCSMYEHQALLDKETGKVYYHSEFGDDMDEFPEDIDDEKYIEIPHKNELDLGKKLALDFSHQYLPGDVEKIHVIFGRKGAYSKFKSLLEDREMLEMWYKFESNAQKEALRMWCEESAIETNENRDQLVGVDWNVRVHCRNSRRGFHARIGLCWAFSRGFYSYARWAFRKRENKETKLDNRRSDLSRQGNQKAKETSCGRPTRRLDMGFPADL